MDGQTQKQQQQQQQQQRWLIIDTDVGFDDLVAIGGLVHSRYYNDIPLITTVRGVNSARTGAQCLHQMLLLTGGSTIAVGVEETAPPNIPWLQECRRQLQQLLSVPNNSSDDDDDDRADEGIPVKETTTNDHVRRILEETAARDNTTVNGESNADIPDNANSSPKVDLLCLGPLSNVAQWVSDETLQPLLQDRVGTVWILGGNTPAIDNRVEFNFKQDPGAAATVLGSSVFQNKVRLLTGDASRAQTIATPAYIQEIQDFAAKAAAETIPSSSSSSSSSSCSTTTTTTIHNLCAKMIQSDPEAAFYDTVLAFVCSHPSTGATMAERTISIDPTTGLIVPSSGGEASSSASTTTAVTNVQFISNIDLDRFKEWLKDFLLPEKAA